MAYYNPGDAGGNVFVAPKKSLRRSAAHQLVPPAIRTTPDRTVDHLSSWQLFEDGSLGSSGSSIIPDELAREVGLEPMRIPAGDLSREHTKAVHKLVKNLEYQNRMSDPNIRSVSTEKPLEPYNKVASPLAPAAPIPGPGANYSRTSLERLAGKSALPQEGYSPGLGPTEFHQRRRRLNREASLAAKTEEALDNTMRALPKGAESSTYVPARIKDAMTVTGRTGLPETPSTVTRKRAMPYGIKEDGSGNAVALSQEVARREKQFSLPRAQPAQVHPSRHNYRYSDGQMRGIEEGSSSYTPETAPRTYNWKRIGLVSGLAALGIFGTYLAVR